LSSPRAGELSDAAKAGDVQRVATLIASGANVNAHDFFGTPLRVAAAGGFPEIAELLIDAGADIEAEGGTGESSAPGQGRA
jgi:ankyrin repeat protein